MITCEAITLASMKHGSKINKQTNKKKTKKRLDFHNSAVIISLTMEMGMKSL